MSLNAFIKLSKSGYVNEPPQSAGLPAYAFGETLPYSIEKLDRLASERSVQPLRNFVSDDPSDLSDEERAEFGFPKEAQPKWFKSEVGLETLAALIPVLEQFDQKSKFIDRKGGIDMSVEYVLFDLKALQAILQLAQGRKERFLIEIS